MFIMVTKTLNPMYKESLCRKPTERIHTKIINQQSILIHASYICIYSPAVRALT